MVAITATAKGIALLIALLASARCATIKHGTTQPILVESDPSGAVISLKCDKDSIPNLGSTPITIQVNRKSKSCAIGVQKDGYVPASVLLHRTVSGAYAGNLVLGGAVGLVADAADGAMYKQEPAVVQVEAGGARPPTDHDAAVPGPAEPPDAAGPQRTRRGVDGGSARATSLRAGRSGATTRTT